MKHAPEERLRWRVLKQFGVLPGEKRARRMTRRELLYCVLQQQLDGEEALSELCPACRAAAMERAVHRLRRAADGYGGDGEHGV